MPKIKPKPNQFRNQHKRRIVQTESAVKEDVKPGHIIRFSYSGENVNDPKPMVLVLHPNWQGKLHGLNIDYIPDAMQMSNYLKQFMSKKKKKKTGGASGKAKGGEVRAMKLGGAVMKGRGPKFKGQS